MAETEEEVVATEFDTGDPIMSLKKMPKEFSINGESFEVQNGLIVYYANNHCGVVCDSTHLASKTLDRLGDIKRLIVASADGGNNEIVSSGRAGETTNIPSISFNCLERLLPGKRRGNRTKYAMQAMARGHVLVLDFLPDEKRPITAAQRRMKEKARLKLPPPAAGFVLVGMTWHRAATVLLKDKKTEARYLMGTDDSQYFGVQLKGQPNTIDEAFIDLTPEEARVGGVKRQGEWYAVPVSEGEVPESAGDIGEMILKKEDNRSNDHSLVAHDIRIQNSIVYAKAARLSHDQHDRLELSGWVKFLRNTAVRSVSEEGVD